MQFLCNYCEIFDVLWHIFNMYYDGCISKCTITLFNERKVRFLEYLPAGSEDVDKTIRYSYAPKLLFASSTYSFSVSDFWTLSIVKIALHAPLPCKRHTVLRIYVCTYMHHTYICMCMYQSELRPAELLIFHILSLINLILKNK